MVAVNKTFMSDIRGATKMAFDATVGLSDIVERMHNTIQARPAAWGKAPPHDRTSGITGVVYRTVRSSVRLVGLGIEASLGAMQSGLPDAEAAPRRDAVVSVANGIYGDYLARTGNPLAIEMSLRFHGRAIDLSRPAESLRETSGRTPTGKLLVLVHGLCMNDLGWSRHEHDHGAALADDLGYTALYVRYNSGLHVHENGRLLSALLDTLVRQWPCPVEDLTVLAHSMGGLLARSACLHAAQSGHEWVTHLRRLVFLGTPHQGSPLERGGQRLDEVLDLSPYSAPLTRLGKARSAGIQDLRHGTITASAEEFVPLPEGVECFAAAATLGSRRNMLAERLVGDGLVPMDSALGRHKDPARTLAFAKSHQWIGYEMGHLDLLSSRQVCAQLRRWFTGQN